jgi:hypothetical protein
LHPAESVPTIAVVIRLAVEIEAARETHGKANTKAPHAIASDATQTPGIGALANSALAWITLAVNVAALGFAVAPVHRIAILAWSVWIIGAIAILIGFRIERRTSRHPRTDRNSDS